MLKKWKKPPETGGFQRKLKHKNEKTSCALPVKSNDFLAAYKPLIAIAEPFNEICSFDF